MIGLVVVGNDLSNIDDIASAKAIGKSKKKLPRFLLSKGHIVPLDKFRLLGITKLIYTLLNLKPVLIEQRILRVLFK